MSLVPSNGLLLCVEGTDGSGKGTQTNMLVDALIADGHYVMRMEFPQYTTSFFGKEVGKFLNGDYGPLENIHPKVASMIYAADRYQARDRMMAHMNMGGIVICDRYVGSNMAYQCSRLPNQTEQREMMKWLFEMEHGVYELPEPSATFFLNVPVDVSKQLVLLKEQRAYTDKSEDIIEAKHGLIERVYSQYQYLAQEYDWVTIECMSHQNVKSIDTLLPVEVIFDRLKAQVNRVIMEAKGLSQ